MSSGSIFQRYSRAVARVQSAPVWLLVVFVITVALLPLSAPVQLAVFAFVALFFWLPLAVMLRREFRRGYDQEDARQRLRDLD